MKPAVLLISPGIIRWTDMDFGLPHLVSLGGYLREHTGVRVELLDLNYEGGDHRTLARTLDDLGPYLLIGVSCYSSFDYRRVLALGAFLKDRYPGVPLITGGYHASALPDDVVFDGSPFDAVIVGEGELPIVEIVQGLLGGGRLERAVYGPSVVPDLDALPPYAWDLLARYWPRATDIGRKLQIVLARGCPYHCTFCMERSKSGYSWRAYSPERAVDELARLSQWTDLNEWVVNIADPLFGFQRSWRRQVLQGIIDKGIVPQQFWTLTRSDDLQEEDVSLLARARFSIGIGLESGSPRMLRIMQKGNKPETYLQNMLRLARLSREHGLTWATNVIVGHPGETPETMTETWNYLTELFTAAPETCGWLSIDPFRLYPGAHVHEQMQTWSDTHGATFYHPEWWKDWYDGWFRAQHLDPSSELSFEDRVRFTYDRYPALIDQVQRRFRGQGRDIDRVFQRSLAEQRDTLSTTTRDRVLAAAKRARTAAPDAPDVTVPMGLHVRDKWVRRREESVRRMLDRGVLRTARLVEALLQVGPEKFMPAAAAQSVLDGIVPEVEAEGVLPFGLPMRMVAMGLEALEPAREDRVIDVGARCGWVSALLAELVGPQGQVRCLTSEASGPLSRSLLAWPQVSVQRVQAGRNLYPQGRWQGMWCGAVLPWLPNSLQQALDPRGGRLVTFLGPRYRPADLVAVTRQEDTTHERRVSRATVPVYGGVGGWVPTPAQPKHAAVPIEVQPRAAAQHAYHVLAHLDLGRDAASTYRADLPNAPWVTSLLNAYQASANPLAVHGIPLGYEHVDDLVDDLRHGRVNDLDEPLATAFADALDQCAPASGMPLDNSVHDNIIAPLHTLRTSLWSAQPTQPTPLTIVPCEALRGTGRGWSTAGVRLVGVSLADPEQAVMQVLHEEVHVLTDPIVRAQWTGTHARDTHVGSEGYDLHQALERVAVQATEALLAERAPTWMPAFERWRAAVAAR